MATEKTKRIVVVAGVIAAVLVAVVSSFALSIPGLGKYRKVKAVNGTITVAQANVSDGKAHFYRYEDGGKEIAFVVVKSADGGYRTAFDACDSCFRAKKGYEQKGDMLVCLNCNRQFAIDRIGPHEVGGCNPSYLPSKTSGSSVTIAAADLKAGARFF